MKPERRKSSGPRTEPDVTYRPAETHDGSPEAGVLKHEEPETKERRAALPWWWRWLVDHVLDLAPERRREVIEDLFPEGSDLRSYLYRFSLLQFLAVIIAVSGLIADSAAVVIGAMLVAPLMTPILATSAAVVLARPKRQAGYLALVVAASAGSVFVAWALALLLPVVGTTLPGEVLARTSPTLLDLGVALAAGTAGAYATVRKEVSSSLPGTAVAVALVPPLATVGITLAAGRSDLAWGALFLYLTNLAAIGLVGALVFLLTGFAPRAEVVENERRIRLGLLTAAVAVLVVFVPLAIQSWQVVEQAQSTRAASDAVGAWLDGTDLEATSVEVEDNRVTVDVVGPEEPPSAEPLVGELARRLGTPVEAQVRWTERVEISAER